MTQPAFDVSAFRLHASTLSRLLPTILIANAVSDHEGQQSFVPVEKEEFEAAVAWFAAEAERLDRRLLFVGDVASTMRADVVEACAGILPSASLLAMYDESDKPPTPTEALDELADDLKGHRQDRSTGNVEEDRVAAANVDRLRDIVRLALAVKPSEIPPLTEAQDTERVRQEIERGVRTTMNLGITSERDEVVRVDIHVQAPGYLPLVPQIEALVQRANDPPQWTTAQPTGPGWYFCRRVARPAGEGHFAVHVEEWHRLVVKMPGEDDLETLERVEGWEWWSVRIEEPPV